MPEKKTVEPQYQEHLDLAKTQGLTPLGLRANATWQTDPKRLLFVLSRYKFVAKMLSGKDHVVEIGCGDGFGTRIVQQEVGEVSAVDFDSIFVDAVNEQMKAPWEFNYWVHDLLSGTLKGSYDAAYALDVVEHIEPEDENTFIENILPSLDGLGVLILGCPSLESQLYASEGSKAGHVNCKTGKTMQELLSRFFHEVFIFSMNDEVVHTGFSPMAHYVFGIAVGKKV